MAEPNQKQKTVAELEAELKQVREQLNAQQKQKEAEKEPGWFRCSLSGLPAHMSVQVFAQGKADAVLQFCRRMGINFMVQRGQDQVQLSPEKVTAKDLDNGAMPMTGENRINIEALGKNRPSIETHIRTHPGTGNKQLLYSPKELEAHGYSKDEIAQIA